MFLKNSTFSIQDNSIKDLDNSSRKYPNLDDLFTEQNNANKKVKTVHRRRDLDSLGQFIKIKYIYKVLNQRL